MPALPIATAAPVTLKRALLDGALRDGAAGAQPCRRAQLHRREATAARWAARLWMGVMLIGVLGIIFVAMLMAPLRALVSD